MTPADFPLHFLRPWWWLALLGLPVLLWLLAREGGGRAALARLADAALLPHLVRGSGARHRMALALAGLAWVAGVVALTGPAWQKLPQPLYVNGAARVVVLSLADEMLAQDLKPDRMTRARFAAGDLIDAAGDARTALVAYAGAAFTVAPLTDDRNTVLNLLRVLQPNVMPVQGTDAAAGIRRAAELLRQAHVKGGQIVLVAGTAGPAAAAAARAARAEEIRVDVLGVGTTAGAPLPLAGGGFVQGQRGPTIARRDDAVLRGIAAAGGGQYAILQPDGGGIGALAPPVAGGGAASQGRQASLWLDGGIWLLPLLVLLGALGFRRGWLMVLALGLIPLAAPRAGAATLESLFANPDQRAAAALREGDAARARQLATTPGLRGAADYRGGDFAAAAQAFAEGSDARSRYNLGNALAKQGEYGKAIAAYRQALRQDPKFADARANLAAVEDWLKRHPPQGQQGQQGRQGSRGKSGSQSSPGSSGAQTNSGSQGQPQDSGQANSGKQPTGPNGNSNRPGPQQQGQQGKPGDSRSRASAAEAARDRAGTAQARQGLRRELEAAGKAEHGKPQGSADAFALGRGTPRDMRGLNGTQRALLQAVPDDPGELLRRKFRLEWEQRQERGGSQP